MTVQAQKVPVRHLIACWDSLDGLDGNMCFLNF